MTYPRGYIVTEKTDDNGDPLLVKDNMDKMSIPSNVTNLDVLSAIDIFYDYPDYFKICYTGDTRWNAAATDNLVSREDFQSGKAEGSMAVFIIGKGLPEAPIVSFKTTKIARRDFSMYELERMVNAGSVILNKTFLEQIEKAKEAYFVGLVSLRSKTPEHPVLKNAPKSLDDINVGELLALQYWHLLLKRIKSSSYYVYNTKMPFDFKSRITLVQSNAIFSSKVFMSEHKLLSFTDIQNYGEMPIDWTARILEKEPLITDDFLWHSMPEILKIK